MLPPSQARLPAAEKMSYSIAQVVDFPFDPVTPTIGRRAHFQKQLGLGNQPRAAIARDPQTRVVGPNRRVDDDKVGAEVGRVMAAEPEGRDRHVVQLGNRVGKRRAVGQIANRDARAARSQITRRGDSAAVPAQAHHRHGSIGPIGGGQRLGNYSESAAAYLEIAVRAMGILPGAIRKSQFCSAIIRRAAWSGGLDRFGIAGRTRLQVRFPALPGHGRARPTENRPNPNRAARRGHLGSSAASLFCTHSTSRQRSCMA